MKNPLVSIIMPVYNSEKYVETAIKSILSQTYKNFEFIIIDDKSSDSTSEILEAYRKKYKKIFLYKNKKNLGVTKSLNKALGFARGKYILRMDADDYSYPDRLSTQVKIMEKNPDIVVCGSFIAVCDDELNIKYSRKYRLTDEEIRKRLFRYSPFAHPATIWRASIMKKELYSEDAINCEDYELYFRIGKYGKFRNINKILLKLRMHEASISSSMNDSQSKATIAIRRKAASEYGYKMSLPDRVYNWLQEQLIFLIPIKYRFLIFNTLRNFDFY